MWVENEKSRALEIPTPVVFSYLADKTQSGASLERDLVRKVAEVQYNVTSLGAFLRDARYGPVERLAYPRMVYGCEGGSTLMRVLLCSIKSWCALGIFWLLQNVAVDSV